MAFLSVSRRYAAVWWLLVFCVSANALTVKEPVKSPNDDRQYRYLMLDNNLPVLLISDPDSNKSAASMDVSVGSGDDPQDRPGLAHFLEHMLFLGTDKYPKAGDYQAYISRHGGSHNAYTSQQHTNYFFDIDASHFEGALDRFARFFVAPLFNETYVDKERNAVHSEYQAKIQDDYRRGYDVIREVVNPAHPAAKFSVGSLDTLANTAEDPVRDDLLAFYQKYYAASNMRLAVLGPQPLDVLEKLVKSRFSEVKDFAVGYPKEAPLFVKGALPEAVFIKPLKDARRLSLMFPIPDITPYYKEKPTEFIGNLLGHEGEGSLLSALKALGWAEGLGAGASENGRDSAVFSVSIQLTPEGEKHIDEILSVLFETIDLISRKGLNAWRYREQQIMAEMTFRYQDKSQAISSVRRLADAMQTYPEQDVLRGSYLYSQFDKQLIKNYLSYLRPDNMLVMLTSQDVTTEKQSQYYDTPYRVGSVSEFYQGQAKSGESVVKHYSVRRVRDASEKLEQPIHLPARNPFIPKEASDVATGKKAVVPVPEKVVADKNLTIWYAKDERFGVPKADVYMRLLSPAVAASAQGAAQVELFVDLINDKLNEFSYPASLAGLDFNLRATNRGIDLDVAGFSARQDYLLQEILAQLNKPDFSEARFNQLKTERLRRWRNSRLQPPYQQLLSKLPTTIYSPYWNDDTLADALAPVTYAEFKAFARVVFDSASATLLFHGDVDAGLPQVLRKSLTHLLGNPTDVAVGSSEVVKLKPNEAWWQTVPTSHPDRAAVIYVQGQADTLVDKAHMLVLRQAIQSPFYERLRTEQQLGYVVAAYGMPIKEVPGTVFVVQSPSASLQTVVDSMQAFLQNYSVPAEQVDAFKQAVLTKLLEPPHNLFEQGGKFWANILRGREDFRWAQAVAEEVRAVTAASLDNYLQKAIKQAARRVMLTTGQTLEDQGGRPVVSVEQFKQQHEAYRYP